MLGSLVVFAIVVIFVLSPLFSLRTRRRKLHIVLPNNHHYTAILGDDLIRFDDGREIQFRGVDIELPKAFPHLFLDAHSGEKFIGPRYYARRFQQVMLEGNFDKYFQLYVPKGYQVLAFSILTPDILQSLKDYSEKYDVELYRNRLRLISRKKVYKKPSREAELLHAAQVVLEEIDHKLQSWSDNNAHEASEAILELEDNPTIKLNHATIRMSTIVFGAIFAAFGIFLWILVLQALNAPSLGEVDRRILIGQAFFFFPGVFLYLIIGYPRGWLRWLWWLIEHREKLLTRLALFILIWVFSMMIIDAVITTQR